MSGHDPGKGGKGGDMILRVGAGGQGPVSGRRGIDGAFVFVLADGTEWLRVETGGVVLIRGAKVAMDDTALYQCMRQFFMGASFRAEGDAKISDSSWKPS